MKIKTSITISDDVIKQIDDIIKNDGNRSLFIEDAVIYYLNIKKRIIRNNKDLKIINSKAKELNKEAVEVLSYQVDN
jgi:metal-responsive CopG/Arc/MetJ family transcriptional regulator